MPNRPNVYLDNPDVLSSLLSGLQLNAEIYANAELCGAWALDTSGKRRIPFHLIGSGEAWLHFDGQPAQRLMPGSLITFPHDDAYLISNSSEQPAPEIINVVPTTLKGPATHLICGFFEFGNKGACPILNSLSRAIVLDPSSLSTCPQVRILIDLIINELKQQAPGFYNVINHLAYSLFVQFMRQQIHTGMVNSGLLAALFDEKIGKALTKIHHHPDNHWTLEALARTASMGRSSFAKRFHDLVGVPAIQYLTTWRMQQAKNLLETTNLSMAHIAEKCGYNSEAAFRKAFKNVMGQTPGKIRRQS